MPSVSSGGMICFCPYVRDLFLFVIAIYADALDDVFHLVGREACWQLHLRYSFVLYAVGLSALRACKVYVARVIVILTSAHAVLRASRPIIDGVQQLVLREYLQRTEYSRLVRVGHPAFHISQSERLGLVA